MDRHNARNILPSLQWSVDNAGCTLPALGRRERSKHERLLKYGTNTVSSNKRGAERGNEELVDVFHHQVMIFLFTSVVWASKESIQKNCRDLQLVSHPFWFPSHPSEMVHFCVLLTL